MELIVGSETSAFRIQTPWKYPKENILHKKHGESLKSRDLKNTFFLWWQYRKEAKVGMCKYFTRNRHRKSVEIIQEYPVSDGDGICKKKKERYL